MSRVWTSDTSALAASSCVRSSSTSAAVSSLSISGSASFSSATARAASTADRVADTLRTSDENTKGDSALDRERSEEAESGEAFLAVLMSGRSSGVPTRVMCVISWLSGVPTRGESEMTPPLCSCSLKDSDSFLSSASASLSIS